MRTLLMLASLFLPLASAVGAQGTDYSDIVVFGDSMSDNGNFFGATGSPPAPYWEGRFTNGPVWIEQMANQLGFAATDISDHAVGFATTNDAHMLQVQPYLAAVRAADPEALYIFWAGSNDLFDLFSTPGAEPAVVIGNAMQETASALLSLIGSGAQYVVVPNIPDLSSTPSIVELGDPALAASVLQVTMAYNAALAQTLAGIEAASQLDLIEVDAFALTQGLVAQPWTGGFRIVDERALSESGVQVQNVEAYLFWDHVHPTTKGHSFIMGIALGELGILWGDVNLDGVINWRDTRAVNKAFGPSRPGTTADLNGNGVVDAEDLALIKILVD